MATRTLKTKATAVAVQVPTDRDDCASAIRRLGDLMREHQLAKAKLDGEIAALTEAAAPTLNDLQSRIGALHQGIQTYCEGNRSALTNGLKTKTVNLITGEVVWRQRPPSVTVRQADVVIKTLKDLRLRDYVRTEEEVNKQAILDLMAAAAAITDDQLVATAPGSALAAQRKHQAELISGIKGITINRGVEDFNVVPFEIQADPSAAVAGAAA